MSNSRAVAALAAALLALPVLAAPVFAHTPDASGGPVTLVAWSKRVGGALDDAIRYPRPLMGQEPASGVVRVKFNCSESGRPDKVALFKSSGVPSLDRAALEAVRRVATLHPLPDGMTHQQAYVATLLFATDPEGYDDQLRKLRAAAVKSNAWFKGSAGIALLDAPSGAAM